MHLIVCIDIFLTQCKCFFDHNYTAVCISKKGGPSKRIHIWGSLALKGLKASGLTNQYRNYKVTILLILNKKHWGKGKRWLHIWQSSIHAKMLLFARSRHVWYLEMKWLVMHPKSDVFQFSVAFCSCRFDKFGVYWWHASGLRCKCLYNWGFEGF